MNRYCEDYLHFLELEKNAASNTIASYRLEITRYLRFLGHTDVTAPDEITELHASKFLSSLRDTGLSPRSITRAFSAIKGFHKFLIGDGVTENNPMLTIDTPKLARTLPDVLNQDEIELILNQPAPSSRLSRFHPD